MLAPVTFHRTFGWQFTKNRNAAEVSNQRPFPLKHALSLISSRGRRLLLEEAKWTAEKKKKRIGTKKSGL